MFPTPAFVPSCRLQHQKPTSSEVGFDALAYELTKDSAGPVPFDPGTHIPTSWVTCKKSGISSHGQWVDCLY
jgi:hypothetical protein